MSGVGRYVKCTCGLSDGNDDRIDNYSVLSRSFNGSEMIVRESRRCDICHRFYFVTMHYKLEYEELREQNV